MAKAEERKKTRETLPRESQERIIEGARKGGEHSAGKERHYTPESKARQIEGARKGGQHSHGGH
jgi:general stress protein YciG